MGQTRCINGHTYFTEQYRTCPICGQGAPGVDTEETVYVGHSVPSTHSGRGGRSSGMNRSIQPDSEATVYGGRMPQQYSDPISPPPTYDPSRNPLIVRGGTPRPSQQYPTSVGQTITKQFCPYCFAPLNGQTSCPRCRRNANVHSVEGHLPVGTVVVGKRAYIIGTAKGQGGFGITYAAMDSVSGNRLAIKEFFPKEYVGRGLQGRVEVYAGENDSFQKSKKQFLLESQMITSLQDLKSVVRAIDYFEQNNTAYLVMEYLDGISLKEAVKQNGAFPAETFLPMLTQLMADIGVMHKRGVIHRDIAPDNLFLMPDNTLRLIDFGAARYYLGDHSMTVVVKRGYAPVEQYLRTGIQNTADVYALAAVIYFCLTGREPTDAADRMYNSQELLPPNKLGAKLPGYQEKALMKAMAVQPKDRIQSMEEFHTALNRKPSKTVPILAAVGVLVLLAAAGTVLAMQLTKEKTAEPTAAETVPLTTATAVLPAGAQTPTEETTAEIYELPSAEAEVLLAEEEDIYYVDCGGYAAVTGVANTNCKTLTLPDTLDGLPVRVLGDDAFHGCSLLESVTIPAGVARIGRNPFADCPKLQEILTAEDSTSFRQENGVLFTKDGTVLVAYPANMAPGPYTVPEGVREIGDGAFSACNGLTGIEFPKSLRRIGSYAFYQNVTISVVSVPKSVTEIGDYAFAQCKGLNKITLTDGLVRLGSFALQETPITEITLPKTLTELGEAVFLCCGKLRTFQLDAQNEAFTLISGVLFSKDETVLIAAPPATMESYTSQDLGNKKWTYYMPKTVTEIARGAFSNSHIEAIRLVEGLEKIGRQAFYKADSLTAVTLPVSVETIEPGAFAACQELTTFNVTYGNPCFNAEYGVLYNKDWTTLVVCGSGLSTIQSIRTSVERIEEEAFWGCDKLKEVSLPPALTSIERRAFADCITLRRVLFQGTKLMQIEHEAFVGCKVLSSIEVPSDCSVAADAFPAGTRVERS